MLFWHMTNVKLSQIVLNQQKKENGNRGSKASTMKSNQE